jgi:hypothetical protein
VFDRDVALNTSDPALAGVLAALSAREPLFHRTGFGTTRAEADAAMAADFVEIGASGRVYSRDYVLGVVDERDRAGTTEVLEPAEVACRALAADLYQLTYRLAQADRVTWRSSIWRRGGPAGWQVVFHQGTVVQADAGRAEAGWLSSGPPR